MVPINDDIADGAEMIWHDYGRITARVAMKRCVTKRQAIERFSLTSQAK